MPLGRAPPASPAPSTTSPAAAARAPSPRSFAKSATSTAIRTAKGFQAKLSYVEERRREPWADGNAAVHSASDYVAARRYSDALGRARFQMQQRVIGASGGALQWVVEGQSHYNQLGLVAKTHVPYALRAGSAVVEAPPGVASTLFDYRFNGGADLDPLGRPHRVTPPDGHPVTTYHGARRTVTYHPAPGGGSSAAAPQEEPPVAAQLSGETAPGAAASASTEAPAAAAQASAPLVSPPDAEGVSQAPIPPREARGSPETPPAPAVRERPPPTAAAPRPTATRALSPVPAPPPGRWLRSGPRSRSSAAGWRSPPA